MDKTNLLCFALVHILLCLTVTFAMPPNEIRRSYQEESQRYRIHSCEDNDVLHAVCYQCGRFYGSKKLFEDCCLTGTSSNKFMNVCELALFQRR